METSIIVTRDHEIHTGHRVVGQGGACERLHGHDFQISFTCTAKTLNDIGMIIDYASIRDILCKWLDDNWDHRYLMWDEDPFLEYVPKEWGDCGVVAVPFNPTSEEIAKYLLEEIGPELLTTANVTLSKVEVRETSKCRAVAWVNGSA